MGILSLVARKNSKIVIEIEGKDSEVTMQELLKAFERGFGELDG